MEPEVRDPDLISLAGPSHCKHVHRDLDARGLQARAEKARIEDSCLIFQWPKIAPACGMVEKPRHVFQRREQFLICIERTVSLSQVLVVTVHVPHDLVPHVVQVGHISPL